MSVILIAYIGSIFIEAAAPEWRYLKYSVPILAVLICMIASIMKPQKNRCEITIKVYAPWFVLYGALLFLAVIPWPGREGYSWRVFEEGCLILAPLIFAFCMSYLTDDRGVFIIAKYLFLSFAAIYLAKTGISSLGALNTVKEEGLVNLIRTSTLGSESIESFVFGLFGLFFLTIKKKAWGILAVVLLILSFKRIAIVGFSVAFVFYWMMVAFEAYRWNNRLSRTGIAVLAVVGNLFLVYLLVLFAGGVFDEQIYEITGKTANGVTMGRRLLYEYVIDDVGSWQWFGIGLGSIWRLLTSTEYVLTSMHSDLLKIVIESGVFGFCLWIFVLYYVASVSAVSLALTVYVNILFLTDNVFLYFNVMTAYYLLIFVALSVYRKERWRLVGNLSRCPAEVAGISK